MNYLIFGGSGFIGTHLIHLLNAEVLQPCDKIYDIDIVMPGEEGIVPGVVESNPNVEYIRLDVREPLEFDFTPGPDDIIFNFAAILRSPGHEDHEYFDTNIRGAENVISFAEKHGIRRILFVSSMSVYGPSEELKEETTIPMPNAPYGISKIIAEKLHEIWQAKDSSRELIILRPGVVYGKGEEGNFTRLYRGIRRGYFFYPGRKDTIKACIYVKDLVSFMVFLLRNGANPGVRLYNCTFDPPFTIEQICTSMKIGTGMQRYIPLIPGGLLLFAAGVLGPIGGKKLGLHPDRVKKLMVSTNMCGKKMAESGFQFTYSLEDSIHDWFVDCGNEILF